MALNLAMKPLAVSKTCTLNSAVPCIRLAAVRSAVGVCVPAAHVDDSRPLRSLTKSATSPNGRSCQLICRAEATTASPTTEPIVKMDNVSDAFATVVSVERSGQTGELLETITALKNLGLNIRRAKLATKTTGGDTTDVNTFYITDAQTSEKIVRSARLEEIRLTVLNSLTEAFPEGAGSYGRTPLAPSASPGGSTDQLLSPLGNRRAVVQTTIDVSEAPNAACSVLKIATKDRAGLLVDIVQVLKDINLNVVSAEVDTIGNVVQDEFFVTYHGEPLNTSMVTLVTNALQYYLSLGEVAKEESY